MTGRLVGKVALVTGGTSGIGRATAELFRDEGATVVITGRDPERTAKAGADLGVTALVADAAEPASGPATVVAVERAHGRLDVLVANAGISAGAPLGAIGAAGFDEVFAVNVRGPLLLVQAAVPLMAPGSSVVLVVGARIAMPGACVYAASKAAVRSLGRSLAAELIDRGIRVNTLVPGATDTPIVGKSGLPREDVARRMAAAVPMGRMAHAGEPAAAALFLASDDSSFMTGSELVVTGGQSDL